MRPLIELPSTSTIAGPKIYINPDHISAVEINEPNVIIRLFGYSYDYYDQNKAKALAALIEARVIPGKPDDLPEPTEKPITLELRK